MPPSLLSLSLRTQPTDVPPPFPAVAGFGVSLWGVTAEPAESSFAVLHSGRSSPLLWNPSLAGGSGGAGGRGTALAGFGLATNSLSIAEDFYHEGLTAEEWFNWPPPVGV